MKNQKILIILAATFACTLAAQTQLTPPTPPPDQPQGKVIFSRSTGENGQTTQSAPLAAPPAIPVVAVSSIQDADRQAVTFTAFDLDLHLRPDAQHIAVRALLTLRNDANSPLTRIPLQISSSLNWQSIRLKDSAASAAKELPFFVANINSDADHTGQLHEAAIPLPQPLAPGQSLQLDVTYSGLIAPSAQRLLAVGAPPAAASHSDWDQIGPAFTGLRGFGNVVWYPVSSLPVLLGDGARLFDQMGEQKLRLSGAQFRLRLAIEFPHGKAPTIALVNGFPLPLTVTEPSSSLDQNQEVASVATADTGSTILGFEAPSLFIATRTPHPGANLTAFTLPDNNVSIDAWTAAAETVTPFLQSWLGHQPRSKLTLLDLPDPDDAPFETGALLAASLGDSGPQAKPDALAAVLVHALTHAWLLAPNSPHPPPAWLNEGVAAFIGSLWVEKLHGREAALGSLESGRAALALDEPESPGQSSGQPLPLAISPVYYRTKAAFVLWMLRDIDGPQALSAALRDYGAYAAPAIESAKPSAAASFQKILEAASSQPDLAWFFADWVDADKGLPDLGINGVFPAAVADGNWLVAVEVANNGYAQAEVPVTVRSGLGNEARSVTQRVRIPARGKLTERILIQGKPLEVQLNDGTVPESQSTVHITKLDQPASDR
jgi:hypothetical protein